MSYVWWCLSSVLGKVNETSTKARLSPGVAVQVVKNKYTELLVLLPQLRGITVIYMKDDKNKKNLDEKKYFFFLKVFRYLPKVA